MNSFEAGWFSYCVEVLHAIGCEGTSYLLGSGHTGKWVTIAHRFAHSHNVRAKIFTLKLKSPEMTPNATKASLNLICYVNSPRLMNISVRNMTLHVASFTSTRGFIGDI